MVTRRQTLAWLAAALTARRAALAQSRLFERKPRPHVPDPPVLTYFGTDSAKPGAHGIYTAHFDEQTGQFSGLTLAAACLRPTYLAQGRVPGRRLLYTVNEGDARTSGVSSFALDPASGSLRLLGEVPSAGTGPTYIAVHPTGESAYVANYDSGTVTSFKVQPDGTLSQPVQSVDFRRGKLFGHHGPNAERQDSSHPHSATLSPDGRYLLVCDLGNDTIAVFPVDATTAKMGAVHLSENRQAGAGPRHVAFHPNGRWVYGADELTSRIDQYLWNTVHNAEGEPVQGLLTDSGHTVSTLEAGFHGANTAAEIAVDPEGRFVYVSNRGENTIALLSVEPATGALTPLQRIGCGGTVPRHFTLSPTGRWLVCGNSGSNTVCVFARDQASGRLTGPVQSFAVPAPMFTLFV